MYGSNLNRFRPWKIYIFLIVAIGLNTCIDPYFPDLQSYESVLVVDALVTNIYEPGAGSVSLSRTYSNQFGQPEVVSGAEVYLTDQLENRIDFFEMWPGMYHALRDDGDFFEGEIGDTYVLHIKTPDGQIYESVPCLMLAVPDIDTIYFGYDTEFANNGSDEFEGIRLFVDSDPGNENCTFFRWTFEECWKFRIPYPKLYLDCGETTNPDPKIICWKTESSKGIIIESTESQQSGFILRKPLYFIASEESDRLLIRYGIKVKQYSLSRNDYEFWSNMKLVNEERGDIFEKQPFFVSGNLHCITNPEEKVLGYFQVSAVKQKIRYIMPDQLEDLVLPRYHYPCTMLEIGPADFIDPENPFPPPPPTLSEIIDMYISWGYVWLGCDHPEVPEVAYFTTPVCSDCTLSGDILPADWWIDQN